MTAPTHPHVRCDDCEGIGRSKLPAVTLRCKRCGGTGLDPEKVKPCTRRDEPTGQLTCPDGCRREWVPEHVRGSEGPLQLKALGCAMAPNPRRIDAKLQALYDQVPDVSAMAAATALLLRGGLGARA